MRVDWSFYAEDQQSEVLRYLAKKLSLEDSIRWAHRFHDDVAQLSDQPRLGPSVSPEILSIPPLLIERLHEIHTGPYRIVYEIADDQIRVLSLTHDCQLVNGVHLVWDKGRTENRVPRVDEIAATWRDERSEAVK